MATYFLHNQKEQKLRLNKGEVLRIVLDDAVSPGTHHDFLRPVLVRAYLIHSLGAFDHSAAGMHNLISVVVLVFSDSEHTIYIIKVSGMNAGLAHEAVGLVEHEFAHQPVNSIIYNGLALENGLLQIHLGQLRHTLHALVHLEVFPYGAADGVVVVAGEYIEYIHQAVAHGHYIVYGIVDAAAHPETTGEVGAAYPDVENKILVAVADILDCHEFQQAGLLEGDAGVLDNGHAVDDLAKAPVEFNELFHIGISVHRIELGEVETGDVTDMFPAEQTAEMFELRRIAYPEENQGDILVFEFAGLFRLPEDIQHVNAVQLSGRYVFFGTGVLETHYHGGKSGIFPVNHRLGEILGAGHIHGGSQAILQQRAVGVLVEILRRDYKAVVRVVLMMFQNSLLFRRNYGFGIVSVDYPLDEADLFCPLAGFLLGGVVTVVGRHAAAGL